jgi:adenylate cyclase
LVGNFEEAVLQGRKIINTQPDFWSGYFIVGLNLLQSKKYEESLEALQTALKYNYSGLTLSALGAYFGLTQQYDKAEGILNEMQMLNQTKPVSNYDLGIVHALIGQTDQAFLYFEKSIENHEASMLFFKFILRDWLTGLKNDARTQNILCKIYK